ncbi:MAG: homocysteine S-methyltransferase family protein [Methanobacteriota archaeon]|nr:MAG: homocysteine S-methyltransferase family protein [Euryarchaeota archaeon]
MAQKRSHRSASRGPGILERLSKGVVLGDGGYLLELEKRGYVQAGPFTPEVVLEHPAAVTELHQEFLDAGAEVLQSLAFYASKEKLATTGFADRVGGINRAAVRLARDVARDRALVAANLSLTWMYDPKDGASSDKVRALFDEQLNAQLRESPDFVVAETFSWLGEALLAVERIEKTGLPCMVTMSFDKNPISYDGHTPAECARALRDAGADIVGVNCLRNPMLLLPIAAEMRKAVTGFVACQPTAYRTPPDVPDFTATKEFPYETETLVLSRRAMGAFASEAKSIGINYIGSCCGSVPIHVREMARALGKAPVNRAWRVDYNKPMSAYEFYRHETP